jgi:mRNA-degrading endonuclease toxin of MazEF toxin-antitoxin module
VKSVSEQRLMRRLGGVGPDEMFAVDRSLRYLLDL